MVLCRFASSFRIVFSSSWLPSPVVAWTRGRLLFIARWCCSRRLGCHFRGTLLVGFSTGCLAVFGGVLFGGSYLSDSMDMEVEPVVLRPPEVRLTVEFQFDVERSIVNTLLAPLQLEELDCSVQAVVYPTAQPLHRDGDPPLAELPTHWIPWDGNLSGNMQYHFYISNVTLPENIVALGTATDGHLNLVPPGVPRHLRDESLLVVQQLPILELMELAAQSPEKIRFLEARIINSDGSIQFHSV